MKTQYEEKMLFLQQQIKSIESERDKVLKEIGLSHHYNENRHTLYILHTAVCA